MASTFEYLGAREIFASRVLDQGGGSRVPIYRARLRPYQLAAGSPSSTWLVGAGACLRPGVGGFGSAQKSHAHPEYFFISTRENSCGAYSFFIYLNECHVLSVAFWALARLLGLLCSYVVFIIYISYYGEATI